jgi:quercetin dioxygenase-like cupin family protein
VGDHLSDLVLDLADKAERVSLALASPLTSVDCPVFHRFGPGIYIREVHLPRGAVVVGHRHKHPHMNVVLRGVIDVEIDGTTKRIEGPAMLTAPPGRKVALVLEDTVWCNVYATRVTDVETLEAMLLDKSPAAQEYEAAVVEIHRRLRQPERDDFAMLGELAETPDVAPPAGPTLTVRPSPIHGVGLFRSAPAKAGDVITTASALRWVNHSHNPNAERVGALIIARRDIAGCVGGGPGEEITVDYRRALAVGG